MHVISTLFFATAPLLSLAAPLRRAAAAGDLAVLNFASVLEQLETQFYTQALAKFSDSDYLSAGFTSPQLPNEQITNIMGDEASHLKILSNSISALGGTPIQGCTFKFDSVLTDVVTMVQTARVVENVGVSAYLGAAHLISDPRILEPAASIMTVEARHQTVLNIMSGSSSSIPQAFDIALTPSEVLAIAGGFISGCDTGIKPNPTLKITNTEAPTGGTMLTFTSDALPSDTSGLHCHMIVGGAVNSISLPLGGCIVPETLNGPVMLFITSDAQPLLNNVIDRATAQLVAGPAMAFIDAKSEALSQLVRSGGTSSTTSNISSAEASAVASSGDSSSAGPNLTTGPGVDGVIIVNGWTNLPPPA